MIRKVDHIGIAVESLERRLPFWAEALGLTVEGIETVEDEQVKVAFLPAGEARIELLEPTAADSAIGRFLARRGEGIHHLTLEVDDLDRLLDELREAEVPLVGEAPRVGAGGRRVAFLHPRASGGVLIELVEAAPQPPGDEICPGVPVLVYLREPPEKVWGLLRKLDASGVTVEGIDLASYDEWLAQVERADEDLVGPSVLFLPMARVDKILLDRPSGRLPSLAQRLEQRVGRPLVDVLDDLRRR